jgi:SAM-dependent methyltransferase
VKRSIEDHAARFDAKAATYDGDRGPEYREALSLVVAHADPGTSEVVLDLGTGTGAVALALASAAGEVLGRDVSTGMLAEARAKAEADGHGNVSFQTGRFKAPALPEETEVDVVTSNFAMHHLADDGKREAVETVAALDPRRIVLGDVMFFDGPDPEEPFYSPEVDDPATVGTLAEAFTDAGYALTAVERVHDQVGVLVAERDPDGGPRGEGERP